MASRILNPSLFHLRTPILAAGLGVSAAFLLPQLPQQLRLTRSYSLDSSPSGVKTPKAFSFSNYESEAGTPVAKNGRLNPQAVRQISFGSILGLLAGLGVSVFSKPLVVILGLLIAGAQTAESYGLHLIPYKRIQGYFKGVDVKSAIQDNVAFKISFGLIFALTGFASFGDEPR